MPNFRVHIIFGVAFMCVLFILDKYYFHYIFESIGTAQYVLYLPLILFSFVLPDIDSEESIPKFIITILLVAMLVYSITSLSMITSIVIFGLLLFIWFLSWIPGWHHRGHAHSLFFIALLTILVIPVTNWKIAIIFALGALSHLIADDCLQVW